MRSIQNMQKQGIYPSYQNCSSMEKMNGLVIRQAKGYGKSWETWILAYEAIGAIPSLVPDLEFSSWRFADHKTWLWGNLQTGRKNGEEMPFN